MSSPASSFLAAEAAETPSAAAAAALLLWERAWSLDEVRAGSQTWSLASDAGLLQFLQEFSQQTITRTHEIKKQMDRLISETKSIDCRLHNVFNGFLMLSNTQFIENRVYDDEMEDLISRTEGGDKPEQEKTREQKEADLIPKIQEAVNFGLQVLDSAFEQLDIKAGNSDSEEETNESMELILEPKDLYVDRPLPYLIGSQLFMEQDDVGLGDPSTEGSVDGDRGSLIDSEGKEEEELEELGTVSDEDQKQRTVPMSDEDDDLFGDYENGEEGDLEENATLKKKKKPTSFTDELASRIKSEELCKQVKEQPYMKKKVAVTVKEERNVSSDDEDIFKPPKLEVEDFSPFASKDGLFSGGTGLFDDEKGLFAELSTEEDEVRKEVQTPIKDEPSSKAVKKVPAGSVSLFPGGDDIFGSHSILLGKENKKLKKSITDKSPKPSEALGLFDDEDDFESSKRNSALAKPSVDFFDADEDLFQEKLDTTNSVNSVAKDAKISKQLIEEDKSQSSSAEGFKNITPAPSKRQKNLFSDEEDSDDLFSSHQSTQAKNTSLSSTKVATKTLSLFDDEEEEEEEELFGSFPKIQESNHSQGKASTLFFSSDEEDHSNNKKEGKPVSEDSKRKELLKSAHVASHTIKRNLFEEEDDDDDFFVATKDSKEVPQKTDLLFEDNTLPHSFQPPHFPSGAQTVKEDLLETPQNKLAQKKAEPLEDPDIHHGYNLEGGGDILEQKKENLFLEKDAKRKVRSVFSLFEEKNEDAEVSENIEEGTAKPLEKSTGVFQDEELLFSHKLQEDNDPEVDLFASKKGVQVPKPKPKLSSGEWLFGPVDNGDDGLFSSSKATSNVEEKKVLIQKSSTISLEKDNKVMQSNQNNKPEELNVKDSEEHLDVNSTNMQPKRTSTMKPPPSYSKTPCHMSDDTQHLKIVTATRNSKPVGVSFDSPMKADTLQNANKDRIKVSGKRRPPTRTARRLAAEESGKNEMDTAEDLFLPSSRGKSGSTAVLYPFNTEPHQKENTEKASLPISNNSQSYKNKCSPLSKSSVYSDVDDLFESNDLFAENTESNAVVRSKTAVESRSVINQTLKRSEQVLAQESANYDHLFQTGKTLRKFSPTPFLEDKQDDFVASKKTVKRKEPEHTAYADQSSPIHDIFEDDVFAVESVKLPVKGKGLEVNLFDDEVDIFADLAVKSKERNARKKMEAKSIFDEDIDDIFSPTSQSKTSVKKATLQAISGSKSELRTASTFEDPLSAFEGNKM